MGHDIDYRQRLFVGFLTYTKQMVIIMASFAILSILLLTDAITEHCIGWSWRNFGVELA
jgi:hypothetical protein